VVVDHQLNTVDQKALVGFDYLCIYDIEANCSKNKNEIKFNECIELPVVVIDVKKQAIKAEFHEYIRLTADEALTPFCTELTGITNDMIMSKNADGSFKCNTFE
jgi:inhibitor of KinA sporulation pathway (predicted exonuclease)